MKLNKLFLLLLIFSFSAFAQEKKISSIDFVQVQNNHFEEALYYYENNWKILREKALKENYIDSYKILKTEYTTEAPFHLILITTYKNESQFKAREKHFDDLINALGSLKLLNELKPADFRKTLFGTDAIHLN